MPPKTSPTASSTIHSRGAIRRATPTDPNRHVRTAGVAACDPPRSARRTSRIPAAEIAMSSTETPPMTKAAWYPVRS